MFLWETVLIKLVKDKWVKCIVVGYKSESNNRTYILKSCFTSKINVRNRVHIKPLPFPSQSNLDSDLDSDITYLDSHPILVFKEFRGYDNIKPRTVLLKSLLLNNIPVVQINN